MDLQNVSNLTIPEGEVRAIHNSDNQLLWGRVNYDTKYAGDTFQQTYSGKNLAPLLPDGTITTNQTLSNGVMTVKQLYSYQKQLTCSDGVLAGKPLENTGTYYIWSYTVTGLKPNTAYVVSADYSVTMAASGQFIVFNIVVPNLPVGTSVGRIVAHRTTDENGNLGSQQILNCQINNGQTTEFSVSNIQLEEGSTATPYEKYVGGTASPNPESPQSVNIVTGTQTVSISDGTLSEDFTVDLGVTELCKIGTYQDHIYKSGDDWYVHKAIGKMVLNGSNPGITWSMTTVSGSYCFWFRNITTDAKLAISPKVCDYFTYSSSYYNGTAPTPSLCENDNTSVDTGFMFIFKTDGSQATTTAGWQTWLSSHNLTVYYLLQTPIDTKITDSTLISQLNAVHEWLTRYGYNATVSGNLPIIIDRTNL